MTKLTPVSFCGIQAYASALIEDENNLLFCSIIGSDSCARGIAAKIVEKPTSDLKYYPDKYRRYALPRSPSAKYHMQITKLADNTVNATVYHEAFSPAGHDPNKLVYLLATEPEQQTDLLWNYLNSLNTPLLPEWKDTVTTAMLNAYDDGRTAWTDILTANIGTFTAVRVHAPEDKLDNLLTSLIHSQKIVF